MSATLVVELVTEELPPKALRRLGDAFADALASGLRERGFLSDASTVTPYATPRRLAVSITRVAKTSPDQPVALKLMPKSVSLTATGSVSVAFLKKMQALGRPHLATPTLDASVGPDRVVVQGEGIAAYLWLYSLAKGQALEHGVQEALDAALAALPIPKVMSYTAGGYWNDEKFVRPAHGLVALHGADIVPVKALGLDAGRVSAGHRFLGRRDVSIATADAYAPALEAEGKVIPGFAARRAAIEAGIAKAAQGDRAIAPDALLDEVTSLVEWPVVYAGTFDPAFLAIPQECLILTMQQNQKYFALTDGNGAMRPRFLVVSNLETRDPAAIIAGNERVLRARLADAKFFYDQDRKWKLEDRVAKLSSVVYLAKLGTAGSQGKRVQRLELLARNLARSTGADPELAARAGRLAKADLVTDMVGEFPELQGTMGRYYAQHDGEDPAVADAIEQHYWPRHAGDRLPVGPVAQAVALADKLDTLGSLFGVGQVPTGDKDPFGLRRAAIGILRILIEQKIDVGIPYLADFAFAGFPAVPGFIPAVESLESFLVDRLRGYLRDQGASANQVEALIPADLRKLKLPEVTVVLAAVQAFEAMPEAPALAAANKRIVNILKKSGAQAAANVDAGRLADGAERDLHRAFATLGPAVDAHLAAGDYTAALKSLATAKPVVDRYFDEVMVMADDPAVRANRLALLSGVAATMNRVADISKLAM